MRATPDHSVPPTLPQVVVLTQVSDVALGQCGAMTSRYPVTALPETDARPTPEAVDPAAPDGSAEAPVYPNPGDEPLGAHTDDRGVRRPPRPLHDPFYDTPGDLSLLDPGTIVRSRRVRLGFLGLVPQRNLIAHQLAFRSTDLHGRPELAVTTVVTAGRPATARPPRMIAYQCAIDAVADVCFPSYALRAGARAWGSFPQLELLVIAALAARGYVVTVADHEGRGGRFAAPREPGHRVLDGIRATLAFAPLRLAAATPVGLIGYSGGGMASAWTAELAPAYAPELPIVGAVLGSPVGDPGQAFRKLNGGLFAGLPALVVSGLREVYPGLDDVISRYGTTEGLRRLDALREMTTVKAVAHCAYDDFGDYIDVPLDDILAGEEVSAVFDDLRLGVTAPACPVLVVQAERDRTIDVADVDALVGRYLDGGADLRYLRDRSSGHNSAMILALPTMLGWLERRFDTAMATPGRHTTRSFLFAPRARRGFSALLHASARTVIGRHRSTAPTRNRTAPSPEYR